MTGPYSTHGRDSCKILVGKCEGKRPFGEPRRRWKNDIKMDLKEKVFEGMDWTDLAQYRNHVGLL
jgi:hypothetical protein